MLNVPFSKFVENNYVATSLCGDVLEFRKSPTEAKATAAINAPGLTSTAALLYAEARPDGDKTTVDVWLHFNNDGWKLRAVEYLKKLEDPESCSRPDKGNSK